MLLLNVITNYVDSMTCVIYIIRNKNVKQKINHSIYDKYGAALNSKILGFVTTLNRKWVAVNRTIVCVLSRTSSCMYIKGVACIYVHRCACTIVKNFTTFVASIRTD